MFELRFRVYLLLTLCAQAWAGFFPVLGPVVNPLPPLGYDGYQRNALCAPSEAIRHPKNDDEVVAIVKEAIAKGKTVKAFGARHSITDIICTCGIPVDMRGFQEKAMNEDNTASFGAGVNLHDATDFLKQHGRSLKTTPAFGNITIGGAVGTGAHGSSIKYTASISNQVVGMIIVDGFGNVRDITTEEDLRAFRIHLGLLGIVLTVVLRTEPLYKVMANNYAISDDALTDGKLIEIVKNTDQVTAYWFPSFKKLLICNWTIVDVNTPGDAKTNDHVPSSSGLFNAYMAPIFEIMQWLKSYAGFNLLQGFTYNTILTYVPGFVPIYTEDGITVKMPAVGYYDKMFAPICYDSGPQQCIWLHGPNNITILDNEITIPLDRIGDVANTIKDILSKTTTVFPFDGIVIRFNGNTTTYMATSNGHDDATIEFYMFKRRDPYNDATLGLAAYQLILQSMARNFSGRSHWGKTAMYFHSTEMLQMKLNPHSRSSFIAKMTEYDPKGVFLNDFGKRLLGNGTKMNLDPATKHCALLMSCVCSSDADCAARQVCTRISGYPDYPVCAEARPFSGKLDEDAYKHNFSVPFNELMCKIKLGDGLCS